MAWCRRWAGRPLGQYHRAPRPPPCPRPGTVCGATPISHRTRHDTTRHDTTRHDTTRHDTTRHDTTRHDTTRHDTTTERVPGVVEAVAVVGADDLAVEHDCVLVVGLVVGHVAIEPPLAPHALDRPRARARGQPQYGARHHPSCRPATSATATLREGPGGRGGGVPGAVMGAKGNTARPASEPAIMPAIIPFTACRVAPCEALRRSSAVNRAACSFFFRPIMASLLLCWLVVVDATSSSWKKDVSCKLQVLVW
jgi:hypothetical protein